jgi:hypothetical protein
MPPLRLRFAPRPYPFPLCLAGIAHVILHMPACRRTEVDASVGVQQQVGMRRNGNVCSLESEAVGTGHAVLSVGEDMPSDRKSPRWFYLRPESSIDAA